MTVEELISSITNSAWSETRLGLQRIRELLELEGRPQDRLKFVHVAGTNGKGSACAMLSSVLEHAGYKTALYTSPHLVRLNERFQINRREIGDEALFSLIQRTGRYAEKMPERPTEFELLTAAALLYFAQERCDIVVLETGLGGRLDATNAIASPEAAVIMNIGLEHTEYLGDTIEKIAAEKAGIIKPGDQTVCYWSGPETEQVFKAVCAERRASLRFADFAGLSAAGDGLNGQSLSYKGRGPFQLPLMGEHQSRNAAVVLETVDALRERGWRISEKAVSEGLADTVWPARMEPLWRKPLFLLDGAHNPQCAETLARALPELLKGEKAVFLAGVLRDKDYRRMMAYVLPFAKGFIALTPQSPRALPGDELAEYLRSQGASASACGSVDEGITAALELAAGAPVIAFGSLYMAGEIRERFRPALRKLQRNMGVRARDALSAEQREEKSRAVAESILQSPRFKSARTVMSYRAVKGEVSLEYFNAQAEKLGKRVVYPLCVSRTEMIALHPKSAEAWTLGRFGIPEPLPGLSEAVSPEELDLVLCPCAAFDKEGRRTGMGGGFYDRFLPGCVNAYIAAAAFDCQRLPILAAELWDMRMERVFTETPD